MLNQRGLAIIEVVPLLTIFVFLVNFAIGFFGVIHSGILNSIAARNYAFETFRNRSNLNYLRDVAGEDGSLPVAYAIRGNRYHGIIEGSTATSSGQVPFLATERPIRFTDIQTGVESQRQADAQGKIPKIQEGARASETGAEEGVEVVWNRNLYGICLNAKCGD